MLEKIDTSSWMEFKLGDLFEFSTIKQAKSQSLIPTDEKGVPYVVQSTKNNMVTRNVNEEWLIQHNEPPVDGNCIVLGVTLPAVSYQPNKFGASQVIVARAKFLDETIGMFIVAILKKQILKFSYTSKPSLKAYKDLTIKLPVLPATDENYSAGDIDYELMESIIRELEEERIRELEEERIRELEEERIRELEVYLQVTGLNDTTLTPEEEQALRLGPGGVKTKRFRIGDLFISNNDKTPTGAYIPKEYLQEGSVPRITVSALNNGIDDYYDSTHVNYRVYSNFISVSFLGGAFYQDKQASLDMKVHALIPKDWQFNKERAIYFLSCIRKAVHSQYSYGQQLSSSLLPNIELSLPIKDSNEINWSYIETYASAIQKKIIQNYDKDKLLEIKTTKQVVGGMNAD